MVPMGLQYVTYQGVGARYQPSVTGLEAAVDGEAARSGEPYRNRTRPGRAVQPRITPVWSPCVE